MDKISLLVGHRHRLSCDRARPSFEARGEERNVTWKEGTHLSHFVGVWVAACGKVWTLGHTDTIS